MRVKYLTDKQAVSFSDHEKLRQEIELSLDVLFQDIANCTAFIDRRHSDISSDTAHPAKRANHAFGAEIVNGIYRLLDRGEDSQSLPALVSGLQPSLDPMKWASLKQSLNNLLVSNSAQKLIVYRTRYTAHSVPTPRDIKRFTEDADVHYLTLSELLELAENIAKMLNIIRISIGFEPLPFSEVFDEFYELASSYW